MAADAGTVVRRFLGCLSDHDADGAMALLAADFEFRDEAGTFSAGRRSMPAMLAWDFEAGSRLEIEALTVEADGARARLRERNRFTDLLDLEPWDLRVRFVVAGGRIREEVVDDRSPNGQSTTERFGRAMRPVAQWARRERPQEAAAVFDGDRPLRYDGPTARRLLRLVEGYERTRDREDH